MKHNLIAKQSQYTIDCAVDFAEQAHQGQVRKYTGEPYINHPIQVAELVSTVTEDVDMIMAAVLHDTIEDTEITYDNIKKMFGVRVADFVHELTDICLPKHGNRLLRKNIECCRLAQVSGQAQTIKLADLINNSASVIKHNPNFAKTYLQEKADLLLVLTKGNTTLMQIAQDIVTKHRF